MKFPEFGIFGKHRESGEGCDDKAGYSIEKASFQDVASQESQSGPKNQVNEARGAPLLFFADGRDAGEAVDGCELVTDIGIGVVKQGAFEGFDASFH